MSGGEQPEAGCGFSWALAAGNCGPMRSDRHAACATARSRCPNPPQCLRFRGQATWLLLEGDDDPANAVISQALDALVARAI